MKATAVWFGRLLSTSFILWVSVILLPCFSPRAVAADEGDQIDRTILQLLLSEADLVTTGMVESEPEVWSDAVPSNPQNQFLRFQFRPVRVLKGRKPAHGPLDVAIPAPVEYRQNLFRKGEQYILFLKSPASNQTLHWRPVSALFAAQRQDSKTEKMIRTISSTRSVQPNTSGVPLIQWAPSP